MVHRWTVAAWALVGSIPGCGEEPAAVTDTDTAGETDDSPDGSTTTGTQSDASSGDGDSSTGEPSAPLTESELARLQALVLPEDLPRPPDPTNAYADNDDAAALGHQLFFDPRFSGPLLDDANNGLPETLGEQGQTGRVSCAGCHVPDSASFVDTRSARGQLSLASGWTGRRTPALLDLSHATFQTWDGRRDTAYSVVFGVVENPVEFNSSRLFVAQQLAALYREPYEAIFGPLPSMDGYEPIAAEQAGCQTLSQDGSACEKPGVDDPEITRVVVNMGKAIAAYTRRLECGPSRFDAWMMGDPDALSDEEVAGAAVFIRSQCDDCHSGPLLTDQQFHNVATPGEAIPFTGVDTTDDPGAMVGLAALQDDWLSSRGPFSDGDDARLDEIPDDLSALAGAFRTPGLRCIADHPSFMHNGVFRSLHDVVRHFDEGGAQADGYIGTSELSPLDLTAAERDQLVAFIEALQGEGADEDLRQAPDLPR